MYTFENSVSTKEFKEYFRELLQQINTSLSNFISDISDLRLLPHIRYALLSRGKRLRPSLLILSTQCVGGDKDKAMPLAIAFELIHTATLIHDDIIDKDELRRGVLALYRRWSVEDAILVGDAMIALAVDLAAGFGAEIIRVVSRGALELCDGEYMDIHSSLRTITQEDYLLKTRKKSASLFRDVAYSGALIGGGSRSEIECISSFGENFGMAYQLKDDLLDLMSLRRKPTTLPVIHLCRMSGMKGRKELEKNLQALIGGNRRASQIALRRIRRMLEEAGSTAYCRAKIVEYVQESVLSLAPLKDSIFKSYLIEMARSLVI